LAPLPSRAARSDKGLPYRADTATFDRGFVETHRVARSRSPGGCQRFRQRHEAAQLRSGVDFNIARINVGRHSHASNGPGDLYLSWLLRFGRWSIARGLRGQRRLPVPRAWCGNDSGDGRTAAPSVGDLAQETSTETRHPITPSARLLAVVPCQRLSRACTAHGFRVIYCSIQCDDALEARRDLVYALLNARRHASQRRRRLPSPTIDLASSGIHFDG
jgi:hypothetical protein